jgi:hypothetical protein
LTLVVGAFDPNQAVLMFFGLCGFIPITEGVEALWTKRDDGPPNDFGILLARTFRSQGHDPTYNVPASLLVLKRAQVERCLAGLHRFETKPTTANPRSSNSLSRFRV